MAQHSLYVHLVATLGGFTPNIAAARAQIAALEQRVGDGSTKTAKHLDKIGKGAMIAGGAVLVGMGMATKAAVQWESAWAGVLKTATADENTLAGRMQLAQLEKDLRNLASTLPTTHTEIAAVAEAAGQLGVATPDVARFTKTMVDLGVSTNLSAEDAATGLARMMNVMQTAPADVDRMGASLVALGNAGASTEAEILHMATRIAGAGATVGASEADVLALSNALSSMGVQAELGSGVMTRTLLELETAAASGASGLEDYAKVAGVSAQEFAEAWERDPVRALNMFTEGVGRLQASGGNAVEALESIGAQGTLDKQVLLALASSGDLLSRSLDLGARSWEENAALAEEAGKRYDTTESRMKIAKNTVHDFAIDLGDVMLPALEAVADGTTSVANMFRDLPGPVKEALGVLASVGGFVALAGGAALVAIPRLAALKVALVDLGIVAQGTSMRVGMLGAALKGLTAVGVLAALAIGLNGVWNALADGGPKVSAMTGSLLAMAKTGEASGALTKAFGEDLGRFGEVVEMGSRNKWGEEVRSWFDLSDLVGGDNGGAIAVTSARNQIESLDKALASLVTSGHADEAEVLFRKLATEAESQGLSTGELRRQLGEYEDAQRAAKVEQEAAAEVAYEQADALGATTAAIDNTYASLGTFASAMGYSEEQTKDLVKQVEAWGESLAEFVNPLGAYEQLLERKTAAEEAQAQAHEEKLGKEGDSWEQYVGEVSVSVDEYLAELERMVRDQEEWAGNMTQLAGRVSEHTLDELARMGPEGAPLVAKLVDASDAELAKMDDLFLRRTKTAVDSQAEQWKLWGQLAPQLTAKIGKDAVLALGKQLDAGTTTVAQIAAKYSQALAGGVNPLLISIGGRKIMPGVRGQSGPQEFAGGGYVSGPGTATSDSIPALLSDGEYVVRASAVQSYGQEFLDAINESRYARGGLVRPLRFATGGFVSEADVPRPPAPGRSGPPVSTAASSTMDLAYQAAMQAVRTLAPQLAGEGGAGGLASSAKGLNPQFLAMFQAYNAAIGGVLRIVSGWRSSAQQAHLYSRWMRRVPGQAPAAPPGRSNHEKGLAIDHSPHSTARMRAVASQHGLRYPMSYEPWHVEPRSIARRSSGGIVRRTAAGPVGRATAARPAPVPVTRGGSLVDATKGLTDVAAIRELTRAWEAYNEQLEAAARRKALVAEHTDARKEYDAARAVTARTRAELARTATTKAQVAAQQALAAAQLKVKHADTPKEREAAQLALANAQRRIAATRTEAQAKAQEKLVDALKDEQRAREAYSGAIVDLKDYDRAAARDKEAAAVERLVAKLEREQEVREELGRVRDARLGTLNGLLDDVQRVREQEAQALSDYNGRVTELAEARAEAEERLQRGTAEAAQRLAEQQQSVIDGRRQQLDQWAQLDQRQTVGWGNTVDQLLANATRQAQQFDEWAASLANARARGVSEQVIASLGLDKGPQTLGQLRQFGNATQAQIDALNAAVRTRQEAASAQAHAEAVAGHGQLGADLIAAQDTYTSSLASLHEEYRAATQRVDAELAKAQEDLRRRQAELATELLAIGATQGRSYADALAAGLNSGIPGVIAAAQALQAAAQGAQAVGAAPVGADQHGKAVMIGGRYTDVATGRGAFYGPNGEPGYGPANPPAGTKRHTMPDGRVAFYYPTATYDSGGWLEPGYTLAYNGTGARERVVGPGGSGGGGNTEVRVFIGDRELTDIVQVQVDGTLLDRRASSAIAGRR